MIPKKFQSASAPADADRVIADLISRLRELDARDRDVLKTIITVEKTTTSAQVEAGADLTQAEALLKGDKFVASRERPVSQLAALYAERKALAHASKIGEARLHLLTTTRSAEIWANHFAEIAEIEKRRVFLALELQRLNRARTKLRERIATEARGPGFLSTDGVDLLGFGDVHDEIQWAVNRLVADKITTKAEIEKARSDG